MERETVKMIRKMSHKDLLHNVNKIRHEKERPETYGRHGTTRWVTSSEFWAGHHGEMKRELARRQKAGLIKKAAGKPKRQGFGFKFF